MHLKLLLNKLFKLFFATYLFERAICKNCEHAVIFCLAECRAPVGSTEGRAQKGKEKDSLRGTLQGRMRAVPRKKWNEEGRTPPIFFFLAVACDWSLSSDADASSRQLIARSRRIFFFRDYNYAILASSSCLVFFFVGGPIFPKFRSTPVALPKCFSQAPQVLLIFLLFPSPLQSRFWRRNLWILKIDRSAKKN